MAAIRVIIEMPVAIYQEEKFYVAKCPLGVTSQGSSEDEARNNLSEAIQLFIESCIEQRILDQVMKKSGFSVENGFESSESDSAFPDGHLNVPISLIAAGISSGSQTTYS